MINAVVPLITPPDEAGGPSIYESRDLVIL
jgi:hypothetical protein